MSNVFPICGGSTVNGLAKLRQDLKAWERENNLTDFNFHLSGEICSWIEQYRALRLSCKIKGVHKKPFLIADNAGSMTLKAVGDVVQVWHDYYGLTYTVSVASGVVRVGVAG